MATVLPPINKKKQSQNIFRASTSRRKKLNCADKITLEKTFEYRSQLPVLKKHEIAKFRNTYNHNLCLDMLTEGFHMSFCEMINLIQKQTDRREAAGPESFLWTQPVLNNQPDNLNKLKLYMTKSEFASRSGNIEEEYNARFKLAKSFMNDPNDQWLVDHFFNTCLDVARKEGKETKLLAEGHCNVGLCLQRNMNHKEAVKHFEAYHKLAMSNRDWTNDTGVTLYIDSCVKLYHVYTIFGIELSRSGEEEDKRASLLMLTQALQMARNSEDKKLEGEASYELGLAYQRVSLLDIAQSHLLNFYESCQGDSNSEGIGRACDAIAKIYARQGNKEKSVEFLKRFVELTEKTGLEKEYCLACHNLGNVCNSVGNYNEATEYFSKAYNISRALSDPESTNTNRVQYGIAMAHRMMGKFANHIVIGDSVCMYRLLDWKSVRTDDFSKQIPDAGRGANHHVLLPPPPLVEDEEVTEDAQEEPTENEEESGLKEEVEGQQDNSVTE